MFTGMKPDLEALSTGQAIVWLERDTAVVCRVASGRQIVDVLERQPSESATRFEARTVDEVADAERVVVSGSAAGRTAFERRYVAITHRPDRLIDVEPTVLR